MKTHLSSKKFFATSEALILTVLSGALCHWLPEMVALYPALVGGVTAITTAYLGSHLLAQHIETRAKPEDPVDPPAVPPTTP